MENSTQGFFPQERAFLNLLCERISQEKDLDSVNVDVFLIEGANEENKKIMFHKEIGTGYAPLDCESHMLLYLEMVHKDVVVLVDVYEWTELFEASKSAFLATGVARAIEKFRGGKYEYSLFKQIGGEKRIRMPVTTYMAMQSVDEWLEKDEDYQFFRKLSQPYVGGYYEKADLLGMGAAMMDEIKESICAYAEEQEDQGLVCIEIEPFEQQMRRAFGDTERDDDMSTSIRVAKFSQMNCSKKIPEEGICIGDEISLTFIQEDKEGVNNEAPILNVSVLLYTKDGIEVKEYGRRAVNSVFKYVATWCELTAASGYKFEYRTGKLF